jgi:hypothetical protein
MAAGIYYSVARIGSGSDGALFEILIADNQLVGHFWGAGFASGASASKALLNNYSYLSLAYSGTTVSYYIDGVLRGTGTHSLNTSSSQLAVSIRAFSGHSDFIGRIPSVSLYNRALTAAEIQQNFNALRGRFGV